MALYYVFVTYWRLYNHGKHGECRVWYWLHFGTALMSLEHTLFRYDGEKDKWNWLCRRRYLQGMQSQMFFLVILEFSLPLKRMEINLWSNLVAILCNLTNREVFSLKSLSNFHWMLVCNCQWTTWQLQQLCRDSGAKVSFDIANTRDSFYRSAIQVVLNACSRLPQTWKKWNFHVFQVVVKDWSCIHVALLSENSSVLLKV